MKIPGQEDDDGTFYWGDHSRIVKRPPRTAGFDEPNQDPTQNDDVERWECLDCGLTVQGSRLGPTFSSRRCPPRARDRRGDTPPACDPARLDDDLEVMARRIAVDADASAAEVAGRVRKLADHAVPADEIERALRQRFVGRGEA